MLGEEFEDSKFTTLACEETEGVKVLRSNITNEKEAEEWVQELGERTFTSWIVRRVEKEDNCVRMVMRKRWVCQLNKKNKLSNSKRNVGCQAYIDIKVKKLNRNTKKNDKYLCQDPPLQAVITMDLQHNHNLHSFDAMKFLRATKETRNIFREYFDCGHGVAASMRLHEAKLEMEDDATLKLGNSAVNPLQSTVSHWYRCWKDLNYGKDIDPFSKLEEKMESYKAADVHVGLVRSENDANLWAILIVTPIMARLQKNIDSSGIIFIDSTSSCDVTESTVTSLLAATKAGAVPIAILLHNSQTTEGYALAFDALKEFNSLCFGGKNVPEAFMTDNSSAEKGALKIVWPDALQLLCHFHIAQAEWRWLTDGKNEVPEKEKQKLMKGFQGIMYAKDAEQLEEAKENFNQLCTHEKYLERVQKALENKEEWVTLFREWHLTRGSNTNNYSEANVRVLKDIILERTKALNPVALTDFTVNVWEIYFRNKLLKFAYNRMPGPHLKYDKLLKRLDPKLASEIVAEEDNTYYVPSGTKEETSYEVLADIGTCSCYAGRQGAFCKHQALVHKTYGGLFPNAPAVTSKDRYGLGQLALGEKCPPFSYFQGLKENFENDVQNNAESTIAILTLNADDGVDQEMDLDSTTTNNNLVISNTNPENNASDNDDFEAMMAELTRSYKIGGHQPFVKAQIRSITKKLANVRNEGQVAKVFHAVTTALSSTTRRKRGMVRVQPTSIARRREGAPRGAKRLPAGRPAKNDLRVRKKRPHCLAKSVSKNVKHAR